MEIQGNSESSVRLLISIEQVADSLSIGRTLAWQLVSSGELASVQIGKRRLVAVVELQRYTEWLAAQPSRTLSAKPDIARAIPEKKRVRPPLRGPGEVANDLPTSLKAGKAAGTEGHRKSRAKNAVTDKSRQP